MMKITMKPSEITIFATDETARQFVLFQEHLQEFNLFLQYRQEFNLLIQKNVFNQRSATISIDFDHLGILQNIRRNDFLYSKKFDS